MRQPTNPRASTYFTYSFCLNKEVQITPLKFAPNSVNNALCAETHACLYGMSCIQPDSTQLVEALRATGHDQSLGGVLFFKRLNPLCSLTLAL